MVLVRIRERGARGRVWICPRMAKEARTSVSRPRSGRTLQNRENACMSPESAIAGIWEYIPISGQEKSPKAETNGLLRLVWIISRIFWEIHHVSHNVEHEISTFRRSLDHSSGLQTLQLETNACGLLNIFHPPLPIRHKQCWYSRFRLCVGSSLPCYLIPSVSLA